MTTMRAIDHKVATGTLTVSDMGAVSTIRNFTKQNDMVMDWIAPSFTGIPTYPQEVTTLNGKVSGLGLLEVEWRFSYFSFLQLDYWLDTFLTTSSARVRSKAATILSYDDCNVAVYLNCVMTYPTFTPMVGGWKDIVIKYIYGTVIT